jgi:cytoskeleton protein RodZ
MAERTPDYELTPGALLRRSRQRYGWSVEDVADELKLLPNVVEAIEQDNYSQMAGWTYAVGYLRGYAKLVGVNIESAISMHTSLLPQKEDGPGTLTYRTSQKVAIPIPLSWVMTAVVVIVVVGGISATYWKRANDADRVVLESVIKEEQATPIRALAKTPSQAPVATELADLGAVSGGIESNSNENRTVSEDVPTTIAEPTQLGAENRVAKRVISEADIAISATAEVIVRPLTLADMDTRIIGSLPGVATHSEIITTISPKENEQSSQSELENDVAQVQEDSGLRILVLLFEQGSWADIRDGGNRQLLRESVPAGATMRLEGDPPFTVFVGNARGVRYIYRGEEKMVPTSGEDLFGRFRVGVSE